MPNSNPQRRETTKKAKNAFHLNLAISRISSAMQETRIIMLIGGEVY